jgi:predicted metal-dependent hydrolase
MGGGSQLIDWLRGDPGNSSIELGGRAVPLSIVRHPHARRMTLRLSPDGSEVRVTIPRWGRSADACQFAESRRVWLEAQLARTPRASPPVPGGSLRYRGDELVVAWDPSLPRKPILGVDEVRLGGTADGLAGRLQRWLESEALRLMGADLSEFCARAGQAPPALRLSRARRRWGSCAGIKSSRGATIRINWRLVQAPDDVRRSVVAHEVAHLVHFDHSPAFHALLAAIYPGEIKQADRWLKDHGRGLYASFG